MNVEQLIRQYLYETKAISLQGLGKLEFGKDSQLPASIEKSENLTLPDLNFKFNLNEQVDPGFIAFVSQQTGKIQPLATADIESYFTLAKQFINIGKPFVMDGVGMVSKKDNGDYIFAPGYFVPVGEMQTNIRKPLKVREPIPVIKRDMNVRDAPPPMNKKYLFIALGVIITGLAVWAASHFLFGKKGIEISSVKPKDSTNVEKPKSDKDSISITPAKPANTIASTPISALPTGTNNYKAVFETTNNKKRAMDRTATLKGFGIDVRYETKDSINYILWVPINAAPADTMRKRDSLKKYFARPITLEKI